MKTVTTKIMMSLNFVGADFLSLVIFEATKLFS